MTRKKRRQKPRPAARRPRSAKKLIVAGLIAVVVLAAGLLLLRPKGSSFQALKRKIDYNVVLVTVDTLRADRIACYGFGAIKTPVMDMFGSRGVRFENCLAQTPLTLPSHTTLMTGTLPLYHGVRDNGGFLVPPQLVTLAELFQGRGYKTSAFVSAYVLDSKWGLDQGFDHYFDSFDFSRYEKISLGAVQRPADEVMDAALAWLEGHKGEKFFTWIHIYDPHTPYEPPPPYDSLYPNRPYLGEIAFSDAQLGRLWTFLENNGLVDRTFLVFASDHGESLGEHEESTHGFFLYQEAIHVPLIVVTPFKKLQGVVSGGVVSLADVMPSILEMMGMAAPEQTQGRSFVGRFFHPEEGSEDFAYSETFYPRYHYGWSDLKSLQSRQYKLIIAPKLEMYDLLSDPDETQNLVSSRPLETRELLQLAEAFIDTHSRNALEIDYTKMDEDTREKLAALGYIGSFADQAKLEGRVLANPREKIGVFNAISEARELGMQEGQVDRGIAMLKDIIAEDPDIVDAYFSLGNIYFKENRFAEAVTSFQEALDRKPDDAFTIMNIANAYRRMGEEGKAEELILKSIEQGIEDSQLYFILGTIKAFQNKPDEAVADFEQCLRINPASASSHNALASIYLEADELDKAETHITAAFGFNPQLRGANYNLALLHEKRGELVQAAEFYKKELEYSPQHFKASFNLSRVCRLLGDEAEEERFLEKTIESNPDFPLSYFYLARIYLNRGVRYDEAVSLVRKGIDLKPDEKDLPLGYFLLADLYSRLGDGRKASDYARQGQALVEKERTPR